MLRFQSVFRYSVNDFAYTAFVHVLLFSPETVLNRLNAKRMVIGHTPQSRINAIMNGKAWRIDVAMSRGMCGTYPEVLEVVKDDKGEETVWVVTAEGKLPAEERYILDHDNADHPSASNDGS